MNRELAEEIVSRLNLLEQQTVRAAEIFLEYLVVFDQKQHDYGPGNIARFGEQGILVRSSDKLERLINLADRGEDPSVSGEAVDDTWQDLMGYALIAQLVRRGMWLGSREVPKVDPYTADPHYYQDSRDEAPVRDRAQEAQTAELEYLTDGLSRDG